MKRTEVEVCPFCDYENTLLWNVEKDGYEIECQRCGEKMMLCSACLESDDNECQRCDWSEKTGCFRKR